MRLTRLGAKFLRIGATGFGGPMALIGLMHQDFVEGEGAEVSEADFVDGVAIGQMLPGPVAVDCATHLGHRLRGLAGAVVSTLALIAPAFLMMLIIAPLYLRHGSLPQVAGFFAGVAPVVIAVLGFAGWRLGRQFVTDRPSAMIALFVALAAVLQAHPILLIVLAGLLGLVLRGRERQACHE